MITLSHITKYFTLDTRMTTALSDVSLHVSSGQIYGVIGASGAGRNTLICCVLLEQPTSGSVVVNDADLANLPERKLIDARRQIGIIFQCVNLLSRARWPAMSHCRWDKQPESVITKIRIPSKWV